jgi:hypothetical protein
VVPVVAPARARRAPIAGWNCSPSHQYPPYEMCSGELCQEWLQRTSVPGQCDNDHAHRSHYWGNWEGPFKDCTGRQYCSPEFYQPTED